MKTFVTVLILLAIGFIFCPMTKADTFEFTPYASLGMGKMDINLTDPMIVETPGMGSTTPGYIEAGLIILPLNDTWWVQAITLASDELNIGWRHQSYVNRGYLIPGLVDFGGQETHIDAYAINFIWKFQSLSWVW